MMSSSQHSVRSVSSDGGGSVMACQTVTGSSSEITITVEYAQETRSISLSQSETVHSLQKCIEIEIGVPIDRQFIYGWPDFAPADSSVQLQKLHLSVNTHLFVEDKYFQSTIDYKNNEKSNEGPSSSRQAKLSRNADEKNGKKIQTFQLNVDDVEHDEAYELPFNGNETVRDVKKLLGELTGIGGRFQKWSGWPADAHDNKMLNDCNLDTPFHSLILMKATSISKEPHLMINTSSADEGHETTSSPSSASVLDNHQQKDFTPVESNTPIARTARKSSTKGAVKNLKQLMKKKKTHSNDEALDNGSANPVNNENFVDENLGARNSLTIDILSVNENVVLIEKHSARTDDVVKSKPNRSNNGVRKQCDNAGTVSATVCDIPCSSRNIGELISSIKTVHNEDECSTRKRLSEEAFGSSLTKLQKIDKNLSQSPSKLAKKQIADAFINLPQKFIDRLLPHLDPLTQLSMRRVCKATKQWIARETYGIAEEEKWKNFRLVITGKESKTFTAVVNLNLPITRYVFQVNGEEFYEQQGIDSFISLFGLRVKNLTLQKFYMFQNPKEFEMFQFFHSLESLTLNNLVVSSMARPDRHVSCPSTLATLQVLKLNYEIEIPQNNALVLPTSWVLTWSMLHDCQTLLYFRFPQVNERKDNNIGEVSSEGLFAPLLDFLKTKEKLGGVALEYLDLKHFNNPDSYCINRFVHLLRKCHLRDIKLKNINALVVQQVFDEDDDISDTKLKFCESVVSLINYCPFVENAPLRNLEKISIDVIPSVTDFKTLGRDYKDAFWFKLRTIKIKDSVQMKPSSEITKCWQMVQEDLYGLNGVFDRGSVEYIKIDCPQVPYFLSEGRLATKFHNLKRLEIVSWYKTDSEKVLNKRLLPLWKSLRLEVLRIENCPKINDNSFIGEDTEPAFLKLAPSLKKMTLGLDGTENITDRSFIEVFSKMKFKTFIILSSQPVKISEMALLKLRKREFGKHIENFPFDCWSSSLLDGNRFTRIGQSFRSIR